MIDYTLAKRALIRDARRGMLSVADLCDAHPELMRAAKHVGEPTTSDCPVCGKDKLVLLAYVFAPRCAATAAGLADPDGTPAHGRAPRLVVLRGRGLPVLRVEPSPRGLHRPPPGRRLNPAVSVPQHPGRIPRVVATTSRRSSKDYATPATLGSKSGGGRGGAPARPGRAAGRSDHRGSPAAAPRSQRGSSGATGGRSRCPGRVRGAGLRRPRRRVRAHRAAAHAAAGADDVRLRPQRPAPVDVPRLGRPDVDPVPADAAHSATR